MLTVAPKCTPVGRGFRAENQNEPSALKAGAA